jgi:long-chain acyl-CoA synthetase
MSDLGFWQFAEKNPEALALVGPNGKEWTRGELHAECNKIANKLYELGLRRNDVVATMLPNSSEFIAVYLACAQSGYYMVPINWHLAGPEVAYILEDSGAKAFFASSDDPDIAQASQKAVQEANFPAGGRICIGGALEGFQPYSRFLEGVSDEPPKERSPGNVMNYTSGTTGKPKGVKRDLPEGDPDEMCGLYSMVYFLYGIMPEDNNVHLCGSPLYHTAVLVYTQAALHMGHAAVIMHKWLPEEMLKLIEKYNVTTSHMVPTQFNRLLQLPESVRKQYDCSSTRAMIHAAAPCPPHIKRQMLEWWGNSIYEYYAATEGGGTVCSPEEWLQFPGTVGKAWMGAEVKIFDDEGKELGPNEQGNVYMLMSDRTKFEYKGDTEKTKKDRIGDFFTVGDIGYLNEEGFLFLCDRKIDMIISGGANIYPAEIENVLFEHPKVADCAVFGVPNDDWGEEVKAVVEPLEGISGDDTLIAELNAFCKEKLAKMKMPRSYDFMTLPRDPNGKLKKRLLRDPYWEGKERQV